MSVKSVAAAIICLVIGLFAGRLLPSVDTGEVVTGHSGPGAGGQPGVGTPGSADAGPTRPTKSLRDGITDRNSIASGLSAMPGDEGLVVVPTSLLGELSLAGGIRSPGQDIISKDGKVEELLQMTDQEKAEIEAEWEAARQQIRKLEAQAATSEDLDDGAVRITLPDLSGGMENLGNNFQSSVRGTLGDNRGGAFLAMKQVDSIFTPPPGERTYTVGAESVGDGRWRFRMTLEGASGRRVWVGENIPDEISHLTDAASIVRSLNEDDE